MMIEETKAPVFPCPVDRSVMFHSVTSQKSCKASPFRSWFVLPQEHEQEDHNLHHLLVAQADLYRQFQHGSSPDDAGVHANWLRVGICRAPCLALGLGLPRMALTVGCGWN